MLGRLARMPTAQPLTQRYEQDKDLACNHVIETFQKRGTNNSAPSPSALLKRFNNVVAGEIFV
ncbi:hypothetical protein, partial [Streptomyces europaeiscabiei]|uniref:hypothetical protein n=1 Tax=Streptomyces europaeiscabiei TaxID=146819 RepID=UPI0029BDDDDE